MSTPSISKTAPKSPAFDSISLHVFVKTTCLYFSISGISIHLRCGIMCSYHVSPVVRKDKSESTTFSGHVIVE